MASLPEASSEVGSRTWLRASQGWHGTHRRQGLRRILNWHLCAGASRLSLSGLQMQTDTPLLPSHACFISPSVHRSTKLKKKKKEVQSYRVLLKRPPYMRTKISVDCPSRQDREQSCGENGPSIWKRTGVTSERGQASPIWLAELDAGGSEPHGCQVPLAHSFNECFWKKQQR